MSEPRLCWCGKPARKRKGKRGRLPDYCSSKHRLQLANDLRVKRLSDEAQAVRAVPRTCTEWGCGRLFTLAPMGRPSEKCPEHRRRKRPPPPGCTTSRPKSRKKAPAPR